VLFAMLRFVVGFGLAAGTVPSSTMIIEITPTRVRTLVASLAVLFSTVGTFSASVMGATLILGSAGATSPRSAPRRRSSRCW
jgi:putative MFS transporter